MKRGVKYLFELAGESISDAYEIIRSVGFKIECKRGQREFRLEAIKRPGDRSYSVLVWERKPDGRWERETFCDKRTLRRQNADLALRAMIGFIRQHLPDY